MKLENKLKFEVISATHMGMCFGVKAAIENAQNLASASPVTVLGELAHNAAVKQDLESRGALHGNLTDTNAATRNVIITAHGASDKERHKWSELGYQVTDTTCPLVHKAHAALRQLVSAGYAPVVIGKRDHVEVRGLMGDFPEAQSVLTLTDVQRLNISSNKIGVISQTTQQVDHAQVLIDAIRTQFPLAEVLYKDTICRPTRERQSALLDLCSKVELTIVVGGKNSNNTAQLAKKCKILGCTSYHVQSAEDIRVEWFNNIDKVGLTAGTSTPDSQIEKVRLRLLEISNG